jgi:hypothetical protein
LNNTSDAVQHRARATAFVDACGKLDRKQALANVLAVTALNRDKARELQVMEFPETLPSDSQAVNSDARLDPKTCQLVNAFVAP